MKTTLKTTDVLAIALVSLERLDKRGSAKGTAEIIRRHIGELTPPPKAKGAILKATLRHHVTSAIERGEGMAIVERPLDPEVFRSSRCASPEGQAVTEQLHGKDFTVVAVSSNTNSFGLKSVLLLAEDGEGWEILKSPYGGESMPKQGDTIQQRKGRFQCGTYECPRQLQKQTPTSAAKILKEVKSLTKS